MRQVTTPAFFDLLLVLETCQLEARRLLGKENQQFFVHFLVEGSFGMRSIGFDAEKYSAATMSLGTKAAYELVRAVYVCAESQRAL
jgi:hypothetical protein